MQKNGRFNLVMDNLWTKDKEKLESNRGSAIFLKIIVVVAIGWLLSRAFFLQVITGKQNAVWAEGNRIEIRSLPTERGVIKDRFDVVLARNSLNENKQVREYPLGEATAHLVGYVAKPDPEDLKSCGQDCPGLDEVIGKMGLEKLFDKQLTGTKTKEVVEVNAKGDVARVIGKQEGKSGETLKLTIDGELQKTISRVLSEYQNEKDYPVRGAVVVSKVNSGELLGLVSWPSFDANLLTGATKVGGEYQTVDQILKDTEEKPMFNRALGGAFPPGSIFKLVTAVAGVEEGKIDGSTLIEDTGELKVGQYRYGSWYFDQYGKTEGSIGLEKAIARSNDVFFYKVGEFVGVNGLEDWAKKFGLGSKTNLNWPGEAMGMVPDPKEKEKRTGERWFLGDTYHMAIGQGDLLASPLQMNRITDAVLTGKLCDTKLVMDKPSSCKDVGIKDSTREMILKGMIAACSQGGTAFPFFGFTPQVACKTGTAQHGGETTKPHAWISVVVPDDNGNYENGEAITVLLEAAGEGSYEAAPVAVKVARFVADRKY